MSGPKVAVYPNDGDVSGGGPPPRHIQELWFALAKRRWTSVVLVPAEPGGSAAAIATSLAEVGKRLKEAPVTAIVAESLDYESARALADLEQHVDRQRQRALVVDVQAAVIDERDVSDRARSADAAPERAPGGPLAFTATAQVVVAVQPVVDQPLGIAVAHAADAVVLCVEMGRTRLASARRTIELIGRDRIIGCFLVRRPRS
jgi:hypothetical protein